MYYDLGIIFLAAGRSTRYGEKDKLLENYKNLPLLVHSIQTLSPLCKRENIIVVCNKLNIAKFESILNKYIPDNGFTFISGGKERFNSVYKGLLALKDKVTYAAIHDTARPMVRQYILNECYRLCRKLGSGIAAKKINDTVKKAEQNGLVIETVDRRNLWSIETPQVFKLSDILLSYSKIIEDNIFITDDSSAMEYAGKKVYLVENPFPNGKITYKTDLNNISFK
ncbi:MAG: 2-C-methyl-D-erythritol 4-phosphate cytidylyltransferase [Victivallales bacterium]|nr:2-C-methyl-D-erythritol 4-phosphate cytidylyltransferase [Victivallales bacterium]MCF7888854.1 2-C-methyl-D-erythritol 4-phosphate cytidylyltransferase [Victivallales bacterium]